MGKLYLFALGGNEISPVIIDPETGKMVNPDLPAPVATGLENL
jgi:hypothetical protein